MAFPVVNIAQPTVRDSESAWGDVGVFVMPGYTYALRCSTDGGHDGVTVTAVWTVMGGH